jgi:gamma-carbonic anhydrase
VGLYALDGLRPTVGGRVFLADNASVIGDVTLGDEASVWFGAVLRGDQQTIRIGARTNVQDNVVIHIASGTGPTIVGDEVTIGHSAVVHACTIGSTCLIGMGSIVLDGAVVGERSFVAAGTLVTPNTIIPARSFVLGRPGRVTRQTTDDEVASMRASAAHYVSYARQFMTGCQRVG